MKAIAVTPRVASTARIVDVAEPRPKPSELLIQIREVGYCGTDVEINAGLYGAAPAGSEFLILGHESFGRVADVGKSVKGFKKRDLVVATVRRPCVEKCLSCKNGESDMCTTGHFKERGIGGLHGYMQELVTEVPDFIVKVPKAIEGVAVLLEPMSVCQKAILQAEAIQRRLHWKPKKALVVGAGPIGMLGAYLTRLRGMGTWVVGREPAASGPKHPLLKKVGAEYLSTMETPLADIGRKHGPFDLIIEATGSAAVAFQSMGFIAINGVLCLTSITGGGKFLEVPADNINLDLVLGNRVVFGSVNANRSYFDAGVKDIEAIERKWPGALAALITGRTPYQSFGEAFQKKPTGIKSTVVFAA